MSKYFKPDSELGYVEDSAEITYLKFNNMRHTILGCMLGDFDEQGCYYVSPQIVEELIEMPKYLVDTIDNIEVCKSALKLDKHISFLVTFEHDKAILSLIEKICFEANLTLNSGTYSNINEYVLDVVQTSGLINKNAIYARWNINPFEGAEVDVFDCDSSVLQKYFNVVNKFKLRLKENTVMLKNEEELETVEAEYFAEMMDILKHYPKLEKAVQVQLKAAMKEKQDFIRLDKPNFAKTINEILDKAIEENKNVLTVEEKKEFQAEVHNVKNNTAIKREEIMPTRSAVAEEEKDLKTSTDKKSELKGEAEAEKAEGKDTEEELTSEHKEGVAVVTSQVQTKEDLTTVARENVEAQHETIERVEERAELIENVVEGEDVEVENDAARAIATVAVVVTTVVTLGALAVNTLRDRNKAEERTATAEAQNERETEVNDENNVKPQEQQRENTTQPERAPAATTPAGEPAITPSTVPWASSDLGATPLRTQVETENNDVTDIENSPRSAEDASISDNDYSGYEDTSTESFNNRNSGQGNGLIGTMTSRPMYTPTPENRPPESEVPLTPTPTSGNVKPQVIDVGRDDDLDIYRETGKGLGI